MRTYRSVMALVVLLASPAFAQSQRRDNPTVKETLRWMQTTLESGAGDYSVGHEVRSVRLEDFVGCKVHLSYSTHQEPYANGEPAPEPNKTYHVDYFFGLGDIDPTNVTFSKGSGLHAGDDGLYESPSFLTIRTRNDEKKITIRLPWQSEADSKPEDTSLILSLDSVDQDYIARFAKAFKHAVEACGGKPSLFADSHAHGSDEQAPAAAGAVAARSASAREDIPAIAKAANGAVVSIVMSDKDGDPIAQGSGFLVSRDGLIVTNYHVIAQGTSAVIKLPGGAFFVVDGVLAFDKARDVAVIKAHGEDFRTVTLGNSDRVEVGQEVVAIGNPLSLESTVSNGIISGIRTDEDLGGKFLQITTPISPGSSGGPLFNMAGQVVGITTLYLKGGENLNFAIPINDAKHLLLANSAKLQNFPNEPEPDQSQAAQPEAPLPPDAITTTSAHATARDYYQQLSDAGGFRNEASGFVCFNDDTSATGFFTFLAFAYDPKQPHGDEVDKEMPYVFFVPEEFFKLGILKDEEFFRRGGRVLEMSLYSAGVKTGTDQYVWDGHSWVFQLTSQGPLGPETSVYRLFIEPATMRYTNVLAITDDSDAHVPPVVGHPHSGSCELIPPKH